MKTETEPNENSDEHEDKLDDITTDIDEERDVECSLWYIMEVHEQLDPSQEHSPGPHMNRKLINNANITDHCEHEEEESVENLKKNLQLVLKRSCYVEYQETTDEQDRYVEKQCNGENH